MCTTVAIAHAVLEAHIAEVVLRWGEGNVAIRRNVHDAVGHGDRLLFASQLDAFNMGDAQRVVIRIGVVAQHVAVQHRAGRFFAAIQQMIVRRCHRRVVGTRDRTAHRGITTVAIRNNNIIPGRSNTCIKPGLSQRRLTSPVNRDNGCLPVRTSLTCRSSFKDLRRVSTL